MRTIPAVLSLLVLATTAAAADVPESVTGIDLRDEHRARRAAVAAELPRDAVAVIPARPHDPWSTFAVRPDENYLWLTGLDEPNGVLVLAPPKAEGAPHREILLLPPRNPRQEAWIGPRAYPGPEAEEALGVAATGDVREVEEVVARWLRGAKHVLLPSGGPTGDHARALLGDLLAKAKRLEVEAVEERIGNLRLRKSPEEIARIRRAAELSAEGHVRAMRATRAGIPEFAVQAAFEAVCRAGGCRRQAYDSIVGSGPNSCVLHYGSNRRVLEEDDVVLMDAGGEYLGYACDVTRTWPVGEAFTEEQAAAYDTVLAAQRAGMEAAKPGATFKEITAACRAVIDAAGLGKGWWHGPCHWVGMGVHDPNGRQALAPGVVFVIEPGVYFPDRGWGIRIEDTFVMRDDGTLENLSAGAPKERKEVEALRRAALRAAPTKSE